MSVSSFEEIGAAVFALFSGKFCDPIFQNAAEYQNHNSSHFSNGRYNYAEIFRVIFFIMEKSKKKQKAIKCPKMARNVKMAKKKFVAVFARKITEINWVTPKKICAPRLHLRNVRVKFRRNRRSGFRVVLR